MAELEVLKAQVVQLQSSNAGYRKKYNSLVIKKADMDGDIRSTVEMFISILDLLGIKGEDLKDQAKVMKKLPKVLGSITVDLLGGTFDTQVIADVQSIAPLLEKYKYLFEDSTILLESTEPKQLSNGSN